MATVRSHSYVSSIATATALVPSAGCHSARVQAQGASAIYRVDGTAPDNTDANDPHFTLTAGSIMEFTGKIADVKFQEATAANGAKLQVIYTRENIS